MKQKEIDSQKKTILVRLLINLAMKKIQQQIEDTLGPIMTYTDLNQAIQISNNTPCDLAAYYFTNNYRAGIYIHDQLEYDIIGWNDDGSSTAHAPFDGIKKSGLGREGGTKGIEAYMETKYLSIGNL